MKRENITYDYECDICEENIDEKSPYETSGKHICSGCIDIIIEENKDE